MDEGVEMETQGAETQGAVPTQESGDQHRAAEMNPPASPESAEATSVAEAPESAESTPEAREVHGDQAQEGEAAAAESGSAEARSGSEGKAEGKKRRRRRKKKGGGEAGEGAEGKAQKRDNSNLPFARFFDAAAAGRRHAFSVGEIVAGRVERVEEAAFVVNLFGKAQAVVDAWEPRDVDFDALVEELKREEQAEREAQAARKAAAAQAAAAQAEAASPNEELPAGIESEALGLPELNASEMNTAESGEAAEPALAAESEVAPEPAVAESGVEAEEAQAAEGPQAAAEEASEAEEAPVLPPSEAEGPPPALPNVGEVFRGRVGAIAESGHIVVVNRRVDRKAVAASLAAAQSANRRVRGLVYGFNRGGFDVLVQGIRAFCPAGSMALEAIDDPQRFVGLRLEFTLAPARAGVHGWILGRRSILEREARRAAKERLKALQPGERLKGRVTEIREYGLLVDIGGVEGLVHQSELGWSHGLRPGDVARIGDEVDVQVLKVQPPAKKERTGRVSLSMRALLPDPWEEHSELLREGRAVAGKVVSTTDFGAFVSLSPGIEGLLHISELGRDLKHANQAVQLGDEVDVVIERVDRRQRRISLSKLSARVKESLDAATSSGENAPPRVGAHVNVLIEKIEHQGLVVQVVGVLGRRGRGYVPNRELGEAGSAEGRRNLKVGGELNVKVIAVERDGSLRCSLRAKQFDEERRAVQDYKREVAKQGLGTFGDLLRAKLGGGSGGSSE